MKKLNSNSLPIKATLLFTSTLTVMSRATISPSLPAMQEHFADVENVEYVVRLVLTVPALFYVVTFYLIPVQLPFYLQSFDNASASASGLAIAASTLASAISSLRYGFVKERLGFVSIMVIAFSVAAVGYLIIGIAGSYNLVLIGLIVVGLLMPNLNVWLSSIIPDVLHGRALGGLTTFFFLGQFLSPLVSQPITNTIGLGKTYSFTGVSLFVVAIAFLTLRKQMRRSRL